MRVRRRSWVLVGAGLICVLAGGAWLERRLAPWYRVDAGYEAEFHLPMGRHVCDTVSTDRVRDGHLLSSPRITLRAYSLTTPSSADRYFVIYTDGFARVYLDEVCSGQFKAAFEKGQGFEFVISPPAEFHVVEVVSGKAKRPSKVRASLLNVQTSGDQ